MTMRTGTIRRLVATSATMAVVATLAGVAAPATSAATSFTPKLSYHACPPKTLPAGVRCARLTVPLDWRTPDDGRTTTIAVRVMRSAGGRGGLTFNPGGPGQSGIELFPVLYSLLPDDVVSRFDFVGWDPRAVGASGPKVTGCEVAEDLPAPTGPVDWQAFLQESAQNTAVSNAACLAANPDSAPYVGTWQVIRDLDALRAALGYSAWNYWGMSYGTRIGDAYARTFPKRLRAMVMDGSVMANETAYRFGTSFPANYWISLQMFPGLAALTAPRKMRVINDYLDNAVLELPDGEQYSRWDWAEQLRTLLTSQSQYFVARALMNSLYVGITTKAPEERARALEGVAEISKALRAIVEDGKKSAPVQVLVNCSDLHDRPTVEQLVAASDTVERNYGTTMPAFMGNSLSCFGLDPAKLSPPLSSDSSMVALKTPPLFVLSSGDAATPWAWGRSLANVYAGSRTITYEGTQHVAYLFVPSACLNDQVTRYLLTLERPVRNNSCAYTPGGPIPRRE